MDVSVRPGPPRLATPREVVFAAKVEPAFSNTADLALRWEVPYW